MRVPASYPQPPTAGVSPTGMFGARLVAGSARGRGTGAPLGSSKDSGRYKVANCTQAQPVFYGFAGLPDGKVILVSVLSGRRAA